MLYQSVMPRDYLRSSQISYEKFLSSSIFLLIFTPSPTTRSLPNRILLLPLTQTHNIDTPYIPQFIQCRLLNHLRTRLRRILNNRNIVTKLGTINSSAPYTSRSHEPSNEDIFYTMKL